MATSALRHRRTVCASTRFARTLRPRAAAPVAVMAGGIAGRAVARRPQVRPVHRRLRHVRARSIRPGEARAVLRRLWSPRRRLPGLLGWALAPRLTRAGARWTAGVRASRSSTAAVRSLVLAAQYQLAAYFSDAVGFALLKQLGGGSLVDALAVRDERDRPRGCWRWRAWRGRVARWRSARAASCLRDLPRPAAPGRRMCLARWRRVPGRSPSPIPRTGSDAAYGAQPHARHGTRCRARSIWRPTSTATATACSASSTMPHRSTPARHPLALDVPGNGDRRGRLRRRPRAGAAHRAARRRRCSPASGPHVVVVVFELHPRRRARPAGERQARRAQSRGAGGGGQRRAARYSHVGFTTETLEVALLRPARPAPRRPIAAARSQGERLPHRRVLGPAGGLRRHFRDRRRARDCRRLRRCRDPARQARLRLRRAGLACWSTRAICSRAFDRTLGAEDWRAAALRLLQLPVAALSLRPSGRRHRLPDRPLARGDIDAANASGVRETYWNAVANADCWLGELVARLKAQRGVGKHDPVCLGRPRRGAVRRRLPGPRPRD